MPPKVNDRRKQQGVRRRMTMMNLTLQHDRERTLRSARFSGLPSLPVFVFLYMRVATVCYLIIRAIKKRKASDDLEFPLAALR